MLKTNMLTPDMEPTNSDKLPSCVNKSKLLSLDNFRDIVKAMKEKTKIQEAVLQGFMGIKTKTGAVHVFCKWMRVTDNSVFICR